MRVIRLDLEYEGTDFHGFVPQGGLRTIGGELAAASARILGEEVHLIPGGRTDAGVHALGQVASFSTRSGFAVEKLQQAVNALTGPDLLVRGTTEADPQFDARRCARSRRYEYRIWNAEERNLWERKRTLHVPEPLNVEAMAQACQVLVGRHDFAAFYTHRAQDDRSKSTVRRVVQASWKPDPEEPRLIRFEIEADAFLRHMVRSIVGSAIRVGQGKLRSESLAGMLEASERSAAGPTAPACGLTLLEVVY